MAWNFADSAGQSFDEGATFALKKKQMAFEKIKMKWEQLKEQNAQSMKLLDDPRVPDDQKKDIWNGPVVKFNALLGINLPPMTAWNDSLKKSIASQADAADKVASGEMTIGQYKTRLAYNMASAAKDPNVAQAFKGYEELSKEFEGGPLETLNVGGKAVQVRRDINGVNQPQTVGGQTAVSPTALSVTQEQDRQKNATELSSQWMEAAKIVEAAKDPGLLAKLPFMQNKTPQEVQDAVNQAHAQMYLIGGRLGIKSGDVTGIIEGKKSAAELMSQVGKNFALPGAKNPAPSMNLPGLTITPKQVSQAPTAPAPTQLADANMEDSAAPAPTQSTPVTAPAPDQLADNAEQPTDKEEANA